MLQSTGTPSSPKTLTSTSAVLYGERAAEGGLDSPGQLFGVGDGQFTQRRFIAVERFHAREEAAFLALS